MQLLSTRVHIYLRFPSSVGLLVDGEAKRGARTIVTLSGIQDVGEMSESN